MSVDKHSPTWLALEAWAKERLSSYERRLKTINLPENETAGLRFAIREMEALLNVGNPSKMAAAQLFSTKLSDM